MNREGAQEMVMTALQDSAVWEKTDRWDDKKLIIGLKLILKMVQKLVLVLLTKNL